jgi:hypothetical protein
MDLPSASNSPENLQWLKTHVRAIGFSSAKPIDSSGHYLTMTNQVEDQAMSQRVEFRVRTNIERQVADIVERSKK